MGTRERLGLLPGWRGHSWIHLSLDQSPRPCSDLRLEGQSLAWPLSAQGRALLSTGLSSVEKWAGGLACSLKPCLPRQVQEVSWHDVAGWLGRGGSMLGTKR